MGKINFVFLVGIALVAQAANACPDLRCFAPPQATLTFSAAEEAFHYADAPWPTDLLGSWLVVGSTQNPEIYPVRVLAEESNMNGVALDPFHPYDKALVNFQKSVNISGSRELQVSLIAVDRGTGVEDTGLGQGAFVVTLGQDEACFALNYGSPVQVPGIGVRTGVLNYTCRVLRNSNLICALHLNSVVGDYDPTGYVLLAQITR